MASSKTEVNPARLKPGSYLVEREQSVRKINTGRESRINLAARLNFIFAIIILINIGIISYRITRPQVPSEVFTQRLSYASVVTKIQAVSKKDVPPPRTPNEVAAARLSIDPLDTSPAPQSATSRPATLPDANAAVNAPASDTDSTLPK